MHRVVILVHRHGTLDDPTGYNMLHMAQMWRDDGHEVIVQHGPGPFVEADVAIQHVDLTRVPVDHLAFMRQYPVSINAHQADISKSVVSRHLARPGDGWDGQVIVKSKLNCGGWKEAELAVKGMLPRRYKKVLTEYPILDSVSEIPDEIWRDQELVVERFLPERDGDEYVLRQWQFFGSHEYGRIGWADEPIIKASKQKRVLNLEGVPDRLREIREELAFDSGKFDYGMVDGEPVVWDANRTPTMGLVLDDGRRRRLRHLANGLAPLIQG